MVLKDKFVFSIVMFCVYVTKVSNQDITNRNIDAGSRDNTNTVDSSSITVTDTPAPNQGSTARGADDASTREGRVMAAISKLSSMCSGTMAIIRNELAQPPEQACAVLEATKPALFESKICSSDDYSDIQKVVCNTGNCDDGSSTDGCTTPIDPFASEKEQRDHITNIILDELKGSCQSLMFDQAVQQVNDPLEKSCETLLSNRNFIVVGGQCTEEEYNTLKLAICGSRGITIVNCALLIICALMVFIEIVY